MAPEDKTTIEGHIKGGGGCYGANGVHARLSSLYDATTSLTPSLPPGLKTQFRISICTLAGLGSK